jgi:glycerol-3-phosphate dehydrogenase
MLAASDWTGNAPLPGGDFGRDEAPVKMRDLAARYPFLSARDAQRLIRLYGTRAASFLGAATSVSDLGEQFGHGLSAAEVDYLFAQEWAQTADDILWRRTKLGLRMTQDQMAALDVFMASAEGHGAVSPAAE